MNREEIRQSEMNPETNPLILGGSASRQAIAEMENEDMSKRGEDIRAMRVRENELIPGHDKLFPKDGSWFGVNRQ